MIVLSVDTSSKTATAAIIDDNKILGEINYNDKREHSTILMGMIKQLLNDTNLTINDIDGFVVSKGPGSFTGLRIGMATVKGLSFGSKKPYVSVSSLDALALTAINFDGIICPIMDALRDSVYTAFYEKDESNELKRTSDYDALTLDTLIEKIKAKNKKVIFIGDGVNKYKNYLQENLKDSFFPPHHLNFIHSSALGELGIKKLKEGIYDNPDSAPFYIKKCQAEREYEKRLKQS
ncbi:tRNA (adenosine(37)-N6)-threonylcarbamoyltransferase complex dimerization subunit type 1 TsaB [Clostridium sp. BJN0001]|uniref:tRNA (adenosine(37)-N6)-threonylcarbamoyltransferase complex dimerization subunit type 1 TsaB n=1 Tax=Clostridium sp. BJN0001 TaxID=2930219 RepID=UPI001FD31311|nr:tRNA (adenosine(37)-N6)-threonylcarbamoyltransferase complex dimerization subunit type 1 TsaB [Clostridium sp. BJN0001]